MVKFNIHETFRAFHLSLIIHCNVGIYYLYCKNEKAENKKKISNLSKIVQSVNSGAEFKARWTL